MAEYYQEPSKKLRVRDSVDVLVAGGGTAGCIAAIAAARNGADTVLIEKLPVPGGTYTNGGFVTNSMYASVTNRENTSKRVVDGIAGELLESLIKAGGSPGYIPTKLENKYRRPFLMVPDHEIFKDVIADMLLEAGVKVYLHTLLTDVIMEGNVIKGVIIESKSGREVIYAKQFVDATGDGDLAGKAGAEQMELWDKYGVDQVGLVFGMADIDFDRVYAQHKIDGFLNEADSVLGENGEPVTGFLRLVFDFKGKPRYQKLVDSGFSGFMGISIHPNRISYTNCANLWAANIHDVEELSKSEMKLRKRILEICGMLRENVPGFENAYVDWASTQIGIRASKITLCEKQITNQDIIDAARFDDEIGLFGFHDLLCLDKAAPSAMSAFTACRTG